jgi:hypothetical protein
MDPSASRSAFGKRPLLGLLGARANRAYERSKSASPATKLVAGGLATAGAVGVVALVASGLRSAEKPADEERDELACAVLSRLIYQNGTLRDATYTDTAVLAKHGIEHMDWIEDTDPAQ